MLLGVLIIIMSLITSLILWWYIFIFLSDKIIDYSFKIVFGDRDIEIIENQLWKNKN